MATALNDEKILRLIKKDTQAGMDLLIETYASLAACIIRRKISSLCRESDVEECVAETFTDFYTQLDRVDLRKGSLKGYISLIARRRAIDRFNKTAKEKGMVSELDEAVCGTADESPTPEEQTIAEETRDYLLYQVKNLGIPDSEILFRRYYLEQSLNEIAEALGMKRPTVSKRIERALERLKTVMEGYV